MNSGFKSWLRQILILVLCLALIDVRPAPGAPGLKLYPTAGSWSASLREFAAAGHPYLNLKLQNGHRVKGYLAKLEPEYCVLKKLTGKVIVPYAQIDSVVLQQNAFSRGAKVALIAAAVLAVLLILAAVELRKS